MVVMEASPPPVDRDRAGIAPASSHSLQPTSSSPDVVVVPNALTDTSTSGESIITPSSDSDNVAINPAEFDDKISISTWQDPNPTAAITDAHPDTAEVLRQVEYYFSDENLRQDAHLLGLAGGDGNGWVRISEIMSWRKMRRFKAGGGVRPALKQSQQLIVSDDSSKVKRRFPLTGALHVKPKVDPARKNPIPEDKPWLTKGMLKPTGFEKNTVEGPLTPAQHAEESELYNSNVSISTRLEEAVNRFLRNKRMHQFPRDVFTKFMAYGGIDCANHAFGGSGFDKKSLKRGGADQHEIDRLTAQYSLSRHIEEEFDDGDPTGGLWVVDFTGTAKGFLSSKFPSHFAPYTEDEVHQVCNVLRTFYNYLLYHTVCPEYTDDLKEARSICDQAEQELLLIPEMTKLLPGDFNVACSTIFDSTISHGKADESNELVDDYTEMPLRKALLYFLSAVCFFGTEDQIVAVVADQHKQYITATDIKVVRMENIGLRILESVQSPQHAESALYFAKPMGILRCESWETPYAAPRDVPAHVLEEEKERKKFEFIVPQAVLDMMRVGMHMVANVHTLDMGISFIDSIEIIHASFYTYLPNEWIRDYKEPGPPSARGLRMNEKFKQKVDVVKPDEKVETGQQAEEDGHESDEFPD